ncbi:hypothetical protein KAU11_01545 [Candidatus Babeliales bacterium]|nr:hypothetical protein [Candidatus Babeliales bacterium]
MQRKLAMVLAISTLLTTNVFLDLDAKKTTSDFTINKTLENYKVVNGWAKATGHALFFSQTIKLPVTFEAQDGTKGHSNLQIKLKTLGLPYLPSAQAFVGAAYIGGNLNLKDLYKKELKISGGISLPGLVGLSSLIMLIRGILKNGAKKTMLNSSKDNLSTLAWTLYGAATLADIRIHIVKFEGGGWLLLVAPRIGISPFLLPIESIRSGIATLTSPPTFGDEMQFSKNDDIIDHLKVYSEVK